MKLLMFDMDGTLINSGYAISNTVNYVRENLNLERLEKDYILENINKPEINSSEFFYGTTEFTPLQSKLFGDYYEKHCLNDLVIYDGIKDLLENLKNDFTLSVATNANSIYAKKMLAHLGLDHYFDTVLGYNDVTQAKPHPEMLHKILDKHDILKENAQMIGDSHKDTLAAKNAGVDWVLVNWGFSNHKEDAIDTVSQLEEKIQKKFML
ncbi:MAG: HAD family hydrolase [Campylobacteraceae bacterium]|nr:HAD family hydrolase [Campylobacteraceae bacterium]